jgi:ABC-type Fe3+ transport system substrate-binding protein
LTGDKIKGHVVFPHLDNGYMRSYVAVRAKQLNASVQDPKPVFQELQKASSMILEFPRTPAQMSDLFANGQAWVGVNGVSRIKQMQDAKLPVEMVAPPETPITPVSWSYVAGAPHPNAAQALMNWLLSLEGQAAVATTTHYSPFDPNAKVPPEVAGSLLTPDELKRVTAWDYQTVQQSLQIWRDGWAEIVGAK